MQQAQFPVAPNKVVVNKQFNSPINLYSSQALNETLAKQTTVLCNGAIGIDFHQLAAPNLANSAVLKMLEEEEAPRGEIQAQLPSTPPRQPSKLLCNGTQWPPVAPQATPPATPPSRQRPRPALASIAWPPPRSNSILGSTCTQQRTNEQTNSSWRFRCSNQQGGTLKRVAWPPPPEDSVITATAGQDFQYQDGETNHVNGVTLQANPPAPLFYSPPPKDGQPKWEATPVAQTKWEASSVPPQQSQRWEASPAAASPQVTVFSLPPKVTTPPPATVTLRPQAPISQAPAPLIKSQPAIERQPVIRSARMRGDQKWPPPEYKAMKQAEESASTTKGPAVKPRLVRKDYSSFFAQHALTPTYPGYRAPPGTQHYDDQGRPINNGNY